MRTPPNAQEQNVMDQIIDKQCRVHGISRNELLARRRDKTAGEIRDYAIFHCSLLGIKTTKIGWAFNRDHTTIVKAVQRWGERA